MTTRVGRSALVVSAVAVAVAVGGTSREVSACGGFFCSQAAPVNQAAERIIFADNGDGTVTAVIQILYDGPSESFSWLLPISTVPEGDDIAVASNVAFQRLQAATNPQYSLSTRVEGTCKEEEDPDDGGFAGEAGVAEGGAGGGDSGAGGAGPVTVEASGVVGAFEWTALSVDPDLPEGDSPADVAVEWLTENGYDVGAEAPSLLEPYLADGMYLLALRLTKGSSAGSIRPIVLTYDAEKPMIPIKLTAVAANQDMGVMTFLLSSARGVPLNYASLELNEARINWFNPGPTYGDVVNAAADDAGGQGFVTEFAGPTSTLDGVVWTRYDEVQWTNVQNRLFDSFEELFEETYYAYGGWDGFWDMVRATVTLPDDVRFEDFEACPGCYSDQLELSPADYLGALERDVVAPVRGVQTLIDGHVTMTRLYSTLSAEEMTSDPVFGFNPDLADVSNVHRATRVIECNPSIYQWQAPWHIELPQGGVLRGTADDVGVWPDAGELGPPNYRVMRLSESGPGAVLEDNADAIETVLDDYNDSVDVPGVGGSPGSSGSPGSGGSPGDAGSPDGAGEGGHAEAGEPGAGASDSPAASRHLDHSSCQIGSSSPGPGSLGLAVGLAAVGLLRRRRRR